MQPESPWLCGRERAKQQPQRNGKPRSARLTAGETWHRAFPLFTQNVVNVFYVCSAFLQPFIRGFIKISTPQQLPGNTHLLRLITCNAHLLSADRTVPHRADWKTGFFFFFFLLSALCSCGRLPAPQIGRTLCQVCPQMAPRCSHRELHALLVRRLRRERQPLRDARAVSEGVWETRYASSLPPGLGRPIISEVKAKGKQSKPEVR